MAWLVHFIHLWREAWYLMVNATSTNTLGYFVWTGALTLVGWIAAVVDSFIKLKKTQPKGAFASALRGSIVSGILLVAGVAALTIAVWVWNVPIVIYRDHQNLVRINQSLQKKLSSKDADDNQQFASVKQSLIDQLTDLHGKCDPLQGQLNECLSKQKEVPIMRTFPLARGGPNPAPHTEYVLTTNVSRSAVDLAVSCDFNIADANILPMTTTGGSTSSSSKVRRSATKVEFSLSSPPWTPAGPLFVTINFVPPVDRMPSCSFSAP